MYDSMVTVKAIVNVILMQSQVLISSYNALDDGRYFDVESQSSFDYDHFLQVRNRTPR